MSICFHDVQFILGQNQWPKFDQKWHVLESIVLNSNIFYLVHYNAHICMKPIMPIRAYTFTLKGGTMFLKWDENDISHCEPFWSKNQLLIKCKQLHS